MTAVLLAVIWGATAAAVYAWLRHDAQRRQRESAAIGHRLAALRALVATTVARETYCRTCRVYAVTSETICARCGTPLWLFAGPLDMADHMAKTFPLPPRTNPHAAFTPRNRRVN